MVAHPSRFKPVAGAYEVDWEHLKAIWKAMYEIVK